MNEQKKATKAQLEKRIANALIHVDKTKDCQTIFFDDKGLRLTVTEDFAIIETGYHRHLFNNYTSEGVSRPWLYTKRIIEIANENDCKVGDGYSYQRLMQVLKDKEDKSDYNIATYYDWWLFIIFNNLYAIAENETSSWLVFFKYVQALATNAILFEEHKDGLTNKQFIDKYIDLIRDFTKGIDERQVFVAKSDEDVMRENIEAMQQDENDKILQEQIQNETAKENGN